MRRLFHFSLAIFTSVFLVWFGSKFIFFDEKTVGSVGLFATGLLLVVCGIGVFSQVEAKRSYKSGGLLILLGFYFFARASGLLELAWLAKGVGVISWAAAVTLLYITWPLGKEWRLPQKDKN